MSGRARFGLRFPADFSLGNLTRDFSLVGLPFFSSSATFVFFIRSIMRRFRFDARPDVGLSHATVIPESTSVSGKEKISNGAFFAREFFVIPPNDLLRVAFLSGLGDEEGEDEADPFGARTLAGSDADLM